LREPVIAACGSGRDAAQAPPRARRRRAALVALVESGAHLRLGRGVDGEDAVSDRNLPTDADVHQGARGLSRDDVVMAGLAADDAAERDDAVIGGPGAARRIERERDRLGYFKRARHRNDVVGGAGGVKRAYGAGAQRAGDVRVVAGFDDQDARARKRRLALPASARHDHWCLRQPRRQYQGRWRASKRIQSMPASRAA
jgi:hypothetical protein